MHYYRLSLHVATLTIRSRNKTEHDPCFLLFHVRFLSRGITLILRQRNGMSQPFGTRCRRQEAVVIGKFISTFDLHLTFWGKYRDVYKGYSPSRVFSCASTLHDTVVLGSSAYCLGRHTVSSVILCSVFRLLIFQPPCKLWQFKLNSNLNSPHPLSPFGSWNVPRTEPQATLTTQLCESAGFGVSSCFCVLWAFWVFWGYSSALFP